MEYGILKIENRIECSILSRLNRFVVEIELKGDRYRAYINNTGRLHDFLVKGRQGFCLRNEKGGKTDYRLFAIKEGDLGVIIDTQFQMKAFEKAVESNLLPWLKGCRILRRNARLGHSLIDYLLEASGEQIYLEVKSAVLREGCYAMYPDCPSARGRRHIRELTHHVGERGEATILFIAALPEVTAFRPNKPADPELYDLLSAAQQAGVRLKSIGMVYHPGNSFIYLSSPDLKIEL
jgi:sugar fermentation stimulation protein A